MKYSVVIPCYNEEENLENLVRRLKVLLNRKDVEIILVENGSKDNSNEKLKKMKLPKNVSVCYVKENKGYGYGLQQGLKMCIGKYVGWLHADLQVAPEEMLNFINFMEEHENEKKYFLKGKRKNRKLLDYIFTAGMTFFETILFGKRLNDIGAIPVLFNKELLNKMEKIPYDFSIELYTLYSAKRFGYKVKRFPIILEKRKKGNSSWDKGFKSKIKQSKTIIKDSIKIRKGEHVK